MFGEVRRGTGGKGETIIEGEVVEEIGKMRGRELRIVTKLHIMPWIEHVLCAACVETHYFMGSSEERRST